MIARLLFLFAFVSIGALAQTGVDPLVEIRRCGPPARDAHGKIARSHAVLKAFQAIHPCPVTGSRDVNTICTGWAMDHVLPLADGGCDAVWNLQWLPLSIKSCANPHCKDRFERKINATPIELVP
jgi:hypothetical protein